ncbi:Bug family tripartite tricarboxylate transporter substrate binding protein [Bordetella sp. 2513F-2]
MIQSLFGRKFSRALATAALCIAPMAGHADTFSDKPIRLVVPFPPGGVFDNAARVISDEMSRDLNANVIVENRPGASGTIGARAVATAKPDGHTLLLMSTPTLLAPHVITVKGYDARKDLRAVAGTFDLPLVLLVNPEKHPGITDLKSLAAAGKAAPHPFTYTSSGNASLGHSSTALIAGTMDVPMTHIPYNGIAPGLVALMGGELDAMFSDTSALPHIASGKLRPIAWGSKHGQVFLPEVPTVAEQGIDGFEATTWGAVMAPAGTPDDVVEKLSASYKRILENPEIIKTLQQTGLILNYSSPADFTAKLETDYLKWGDVIAKYNLKP